MAKTMVIMLATSRRCIGMLREAVLPVNQRTVGPPYLSTSKGLPLASAMLPSFFMTEACLQGWIEAAGTPE